ncbi:FecR family protein [Bradyrhizobium lablabi]|uniref:FecR family protein n=1 Tax=Bradyrhizobium lablabi TaxID=722472 RepID=A0A1M6P974_9BRAD|nr:FecR domain-containing protein [Bradyrhizobium lablabi]SHK04483.1 FecR family protein [Bradyrhizobium lablabi]
MTRRRCSFALSLAGGFMLAGIANVLAIPSPIEVESRSLGLGATSSLTKLAQTQPAPAATPAPAAPTTTPQPAPTTPPAAPQTAADEPIGNVATLTGIATAIRNKNSIAVKLQDDIYLNDLLQTSANSTLGVTFNDGTTFNLTANARIMVDNYVYEDGGKQNSAVFDIARGTVAFVAAAVAKSGDMKITTPTATLGIRGTTGLVEVPEGASATSANNVAIKLYPDPDGRVGRIEVNDRMGARLGALTQGASGFAIRPGAGGRVAAAPIAISPQQAQRDQGIVRQVHAAQSVGRQIVTQKQIQRQQNPNRPAAPGAAPPRQPGLPKQNSLPKQNGLPKQNELPKQPGAPKQPGLPKQPGSPKQQGLPKQGQQQSPPTPGAPQPPKAPGSPRETTAPVTPREPTTPGVPRESTTPGTPRETNAPGAQRPALQNKPPAPPRRPPPPPPKGKKRR